MLALTTSLLAAADLPVVTVLRGDIKAKPGACQSWWCPQLLTTNTNTTILSAQCHDVPLPGKRQVSSQLWMRSSDAGRSWTAPVERPFFGTDVGQPVYSRRTSTVLWLGGAGQKAEWGQEEEQEEEEEVEQEAAQGDEQEEGQRRRLVSPSCGPLDLCWASQLPRPSAAGLAACSSLITRSTDDGLSWDSPKLIQVNNSLGPHYTGADINHGIEIQRGPHAGRLAVAHHLDGCRAKGAPKLLTRGQKPPRKTPGVDGPYTRVYVLYSDDVRAAAPFPAFSPVLLSEERF